MGIYKPAEECLISNTNSVYISDPLVRLIQRQVFDFDPRELADEMKTLRTDVDKESDDRFKAKLEVVLAHAPSELKVAVSAASEKGASSWVTASPSYDHGTVLHKSDFVDACYIRYGWTLLNLPLTCACGVAFSLQHALDCRLGGLRIIQHNEARDTLAQCMREAGHTALRRNLNSSLLTEKFSTTSRRTRMMKQEATSNVVDFGVTCDMRILM